MSAFASECLHVSVCFHAEALSTCRKVAYSLHSLIDVAINIVLHFSLVPEIQLKGQDGGSLGRGNGESR